MKRPLVLALLTTAAIAISIIFLANGDGAANLNLTPTRCAEELRFCPDGSVVGRVLPACDFTPCPGNGSAAFTDGWKESTSTELRVALQHPADWSVQGSGGRVILTSRGGTLTLAETEDDSDFWASSNVRALPVAGVVANVADAITPDGTTRTVWVPRSGTFVTAAWKVGSDETAFYQVLSTLRFTP